MKKILAFFVFVLIAGSLFAQIPIKLKNSVVYQVWGVDTNRCTLYSDSTYWDGGDSIYWDYPDYFFVEFAQGGNDSLVLMVNGSTGKLDTIPYSSISGGMGMDSATIAGTCWTRLRIDSITGCSPVTIFDGTTYYTFSDSAMVMWTSSEDSLWLMGGANKVLSFGKNNQVKGQYSFAHGGTNTVTGDASFSSGGTNTVSGDNAGAFGENNTITGDISFATGDQNQIDSSGAFAAGYKNIISGNYAMALGYENDAIGQRSFSIGDSSIATGYASFAGGRAKANGLRSFAWGDSTRVEGTHDIALGYNNQLLGAQRNGALGYNNTCNDSVQYLIGSENTATAWRCFSLGDGNTLTGGTNGAVALGPNNTSTVGGALYATVAIGGGNTSTGSVAIGSGNSATGWNGSVAIGVGNTTNGNNTHIIGFGCTGNVDQANVMGYQSVSSGHFSNVIGYQSVASSAYGTVMGYQDTASGNAGYAFGMNNNAGGDTSFIIGYNTKTTGKYSVALGYENNVASTSAALGASNDIDNGGSSNVYAIGNANYMTACGGYTTAIGNGNYLSGVSNGFAMGTRDTITGRAGFAFGIRNIVSGDTATGIGFNNDVTKNHSIAIGSGITTTKAYTAHFNNILSQDTVHIGDSSYIIEETDTLRIYTPKVVKLGANSLKVLRDGSVQIDGNLVVNGELSVTDTSMMFGELSYQDTTGTTIALGKCTDFTNNSQYVNLGPTTALTSENNSSMFDNGGANDGHLRYTGSETKQFHCGATFSFTPVGANDQFYIAIAKNDTIIVSSWIEMRGGNAGDIRSSALHQIVTLSTNDEISIRIANRIDGDDMDILSINLFAVGM